MSSLDEITKAKLYKLRSLVDSGFRISTTEQTLLDNFEKTFDLLSDLQSKIVEDVNAEYKRDRELNSRLTSALATGDPAAAELQRQRVVAASNFSSRLLDELKNTNQETTFITETTKFFLRWFELNEFDPDIIPLYCERIGESITLEPENPNDPNSPIKVSIAPAYQRNDGSSLMVKFLPSSVKFNKSNYDEIRKYLLDTANNVTHVDVISDEITNGVKNSIKSHADGRFQIRNIKYRYLMYNPLKHYLAPTIRILPEDEKLQLLSEIDLDPAIAPPGAKTLLDAPQMIVDILWNIQETDPLMVWVMPKIGDIIECVNRIYVTDRVVKSDITYQVVVPPIDEELIKDIIDDKKTDHDAEGDPYSTGYDERTIDFAAEPTD